MRVYERLEHDAICIQYLSLEHLNRTAQYIRDLVGDQYMLLAHGDGTFSIPDGDGMERLVYAIMDEPEEVHKQAEEMCQMPLITTAACWTAVLTDLFCARIIALTRGLPVAGYVP